MFIKENFDSLERGMECNAIVRKALLFLICLARLISRIPRMLYREPLPTECPPTEAKEITANRKVFRLARSNPPTDDDFRSQRAEKPDRKFRGVSECQAMGVSVYLDKRDCEDLRKLTHLKGMTVVCVDLLPGCGKILKTSSKSHYTWWPFADFNVVMNYPLEEAS